MTQAIFRVVCCYFSDYKVEVNLKAKYPLHDRWLHVSEAGLTDHKQLNRCQKDLKNSPSRFKIIGNTDLNANKFSENNNFEHK